MRCLRTLAVLMIFAVALSSVTVVRAGEVADVVVRHESDWLVVDLQLTDLLDARTRSTIESGLPGSCLLEIELRDDRAEFVVTRRLERSLEVDLWDNVVRLIESGHELVFMSLAQADSAWSKWPSLRMVKWSSLSQGGSYQLQVSVHVQPLGAEERERVSQWVSESGRGDRTDVSIDMGGLVRRFFGKRDDEGGADVWRGPVFTLDSVKRTP